ncbi:MAG: helix-turn-helix domain-containing protein [Clostridiales bacterium]|nr:helix-turn-helix domain-containing protein [Clostridiales bacterium]
MPTDTIIDESGVRARIKHVRTISGLTQAELGSKIGLSREMVCQIEDGARKPKVSILVSMGYLFGIDENWLLTGEGEMGPNWEDREEVSTIGAEILHLVKTSPKEVGENVLSLLKSMKRARYESAR